MGDFDVIGVATSGEYYRNEGRCQARQGFTLVYACGNTTWEFYAPDGERLRPP